MEYGHINVSVSSHYSAPTSTSDTVTQGLLGEKVAILERQPTHILVQQKDGYQSWVPEDQLVLEGSQSGEKLLIRNHFVSLFSAPSKTSRRIRDAVIGCYLQVVDAKGDWNRVVLPDGEEGWTEINNFGSFPQFSTSSILSLAQEFLGYQYLWGGRSPKGFDCSGFVQTVFGLHGLQLQRDAWQQQQYHQISTNYHDAQPGDLLFFSTKPETVTHVAISLGEERYIHASGWVRLDSFNENDSVFTKQRAQSFVSVNRYPMTGEK